MKDKLENCAAQVVLRQRQTKSQVEHVTRRLVKNEVRSGGGGVGGKNRVLIKAIVSSYRFHTRQLQPC